MSVALNEGYLRRIGADLHDGPAQLVALAAMKLDDPLLIAANSTSEIASARSGTSGQVLTMLYDEIRSICGGLILPHIETVQTAELITHAARAHEQRTGTKVQLALSRFRQRSRYRGRSASTALSRRRSAIRIAMPAVWARQSRSTLEEPDVLWWKCRTRVGVRSPAKIRRDALGPRRAYANG